MKKLRKKPSKRSPLKLRYSIVSKIKQYKKKMRKESNKMKRNGIARKARREPGIPNSYPFKEQVIDEAIKEKQAEKAEKERKRKKAQEPLVEDADYEGLQEVQVGKIIRPKTEKKKKNDEPAPKKKTKKEYLEEMKTVLDESDVLLVVLDARIPSESRVKEIEAQCAEKGKKMILVLNKADLVPNNVLDQWNAKLSKEHPTVVFTTEADEDTVKSQCAELAKRVEELLADHAQVKVGIVGYPTVGKKSLFAALSKFVTSTKISLTKTVGVAFGQAGPNSLLVKNVATLEDLADPYMPVHALTKKVPKDKLLLEYEIPDYGNTQEFLASVATKAGMLLKGGLPDYDSAARTVLQDWARGKVAYYQDPNEEEMDKGEAEEGAEGKDME